MSSGQLVCFVIVKSPLRLPNCSIPAGTVQNRTAICNAQRKNVVHGLESRVVKRQTFPIGGRGCRRTFLKCTQISKAPVCKALTKDAGTRIRGLQREMYSRYWSLDVSKIHRVSCATSAVWR